MVFFHPAPVLPRISEIVSELPHLVVHSRQGDEALVVVQPHAVLDVLAVLGVLGVRVAVVLHLEGDVILRQVTTMLNLVQTSSSPFRFPFARPWTFLGWQRSPKGSKQFNAVCALLC